MNTTDYIWMNGELVKWDDARIHVLTHTLHYGAGVFEGIRMYSTEKGPAVFRLSEHVERLFYSANAISMRIPFSEKNIFDAIVKTAKENKIESGYIRPLAYYGYGTLGLDPAGAPVDVSISCWPWGKYLPHDMVDIKTSSYIRIHPDSTVADAKICGHYVNSILAALEVKGSKYHEALLLDSNGNIAEGPGENLFIVENGKLFTPEKGTILPGITRSTVFELAESLGIDVEEAIINQKRAYKADEAFFTGTAAEITPIKSIDDKIIADGNIGPISRKMMDGYHDIVSGKNKHFHKYLTYVSES